jgi:hypothetical protein
MKKIYVLLSAMLLGAGLYAQGDDCVTAVPVTPGTYTANGPSSGGGAANNCFSGASNADWYSFTPTCDGTIDVTSTNDPSLTDTRLSVYSGTCGALSCVASDDDGGTGFTSTVSGVAVTAGNTYYIEWDDNWSGNGFQWDLVFNLPGGVLPISGVSASNITNVGVDLAWTASSNGETAWNVEYGVAGFTQGSGTVVNVMTTPSISLTGLNPETTYDIYITDPNDPCTGSMITITTLPLCPSPLGVSASAGAVDAQINWTAGGLETMWDVEWGTTGFVLGSGTLDNGLTVTNDNLNGLNELECYHYYVRAVCDLNTTDGVDTTSLWVGPQEFCTVSSCPEPSNLTANISVANQADLGWTSNGIESQWTIEYGPTGFMPGTGSTMSTNTNPTTVSGLMSDTDYDFYVWAICTPGSDSSFVVGPMQFHTMVTCPAVSGLNISNLTTSSADLGWTVGGVETEWNVEYGPAGFTLGSGTTVNVLTTPMTSVTGLTGGTSYDFYVQAVCGSGDSAQWVGPYNFVTIPTCPVPTNLTAINISQTAANLMWQAGGSETSWNVEYGMAGFTPGTGTMVTGTSNNPYYATGLSTGTDYEFYVQAFCGAGDMSTWAGPYSFTTLCGIEMAPYSQNFDASNTTVPNCWDASIGEWQVNTSGNSGPDYGVSGAVDHTTGSGNYVWVDGSGNLLTSELVSPQIDFSSLTTPTVGFWLLSNNTNDLLNNVITLEAMNGGNWVTIATYSGNNPSWVNLEFPIPANIQTTTQFRIVATQGTGSGNAFYNDLLVDDFYVMDPPPCTVNAGTAVGGVVCLNPGQPTDIFDAITGYSDGNGTFYYPAAQAGAQTFAGSNGSLILTGLTENTPYTFDYVVGGGNCADTLSFTYSWSTAANAGGDGTVTTCSYHSVVLIQELMGQVDMGGTWTDVDNAGGLFNGIFDATGVAAGTYNFMYTVSNGTCSDDANVAVTIDECLSINENENTTLVVYPNPVNSTLTVANINVDGNATITLVDLQGKIVYNNTVSNLTGNYQIDMSNFESGVYFVRVTTNNSNQEIKVVKQ